MVLDQVLDVFDAVGSWIPGAVEGLIPMFWTAPATAGEEGQLTFLGILACAGLGFSVIFLCLGIIQRFLHFAG